MTRCRFLVDECVPSALARGLRRWLPDVLVLQVGEPQAPKKGTPDAELLAFCEKEKRLLITADRSTMPDCVEHHLQEGGHTWGVLLVGPEASLGQVIEELSLVYEASEDAEWIDVLYYLPFSV
jgi:hypothetical protein